MGNLLAPTTHSPERLHQVYRGNPQQPSAKECGAVLSDGEAPVGFLERPLGPTFPRGANLELQHLRAEEQKAILLSLDWSGAFGSISLEALWSSLEGHDFAPEDVKFLKEFYGDSWFRVAMDAGATADLPSSKGNRQGALLSPLRFILLLNLLPRVLRHEGLTMNLGEGSLDTHAVSDYADDLAGALTNRSDAQKVVIICERFAQWS